MITRVCKVRRKSSGQKKFKFPVSDSNFMEPMFCDWPKRWCVQVAKCPQGVAVRDSKDKKKTTLFFTHDEWKAFAKGVKAGQFD